MGKQEIKIPFKTFCEEMCLHRKWGTHCELKKYQGRIPKAGKRGCGIWAKYGIKE